MDFATELALRADPSKLMDLLGFTPDPWQKTLLQSRNKRLLLLSSRQLGKTTCTACVALYTACFNNNALVLLVSRSERQSEILFDKVVKFHKELQPVKAVREMALSIELANGSSIVALPGSGDTIRGFSAPALIVIDEASRVPDDVLSACLPMLVSNNGRLLALSTPRGKLGFFYEKWVSADPAWTRINARACDSPRISAEALAEQRASLGPRLYASEFENVFLEDEDAAFSEDSIERIFMVDDDDRKLTALDIANM